MSEAKVVIEPYDDSMFDEFVEVYLQDNFLRIDPGNPSHAKSMRKTLTREDSVLMAIRDARTRELLGYCDVHDTCKHPWELGIKLLKRHWGRGIGYEALSRFIPIMAEEYGQEGFIAKIMPDNLASIRLFQKLGAAPREVRRSTFMLNDEMVERFADEHPELVDDTVVEMAALFGVEPKYLLGRVLVFDVPANPPRAERSGQAETQSERKSKDLSSAIQGSEGEFYASELAKDLTAIKDLADGDGDEASEAFANAFAELRAKWNL